MKGSDKAVVLGVLMVVVLGVFYFMVISPKRDKASQLGKDIAGLNSQVDQQKQAADFGEQARAQFPTYYGRLVVMGKAVPDGADTPSLLVQLSSISHRTHVTFAGITLGQGGDAASATGGTASSTPPPSGTSTTPGPSGSGSSSGSTPSSSSGSTAAPAASTTPAPATETSAASLPIGATVGPGDLGVMPYDLSFYGNYFQVADFLKGVDALVHAHGTTQVAADGRLLTINGFSLDKPGGNPDSPTLQVALSVTSYVTPANQGLTAGATPSGPGSSLTQPQAQPASATVSP